MVAVDDSNPGLIREIINSNVEIRKVSFRRDLSKMTMAAASFVRHEQVRIHPKFTKLLSQLKMVRFNEMGHPDKSLLSFDLGDAFLMAIHKIESSDWFPMMCHCNALSQQRPSLFLFLISREVLFSAWSSFALKDLCGSNKIIIPCFCPFFNSL